MARLVLRSLSAVVSLAKLESGKWRLVISNQSLTPAASLIDPIPSTPIGPILNYPSGESEPHSWGHEAPLDSGGTACHPSPAFVGHTCRPSIAEIAMAVSILAKKSGSGNGVFPTMQGSCNKLSDLRQL